jgi:hypothetical protein
MAPTRAQFEAELVRRAGPWMAKVSMATTVLGTNADLASPIAYALRASGYTLATAGDPTTELRLLENIYQAYTAVDSSAAVVKAALDQFRQAIRQRIAELRSRVGILYGIGDTYGAFAVTLTRTDGYSELAADE